MGIRLNDPTFGTITLHAFIRVAERNDVVLPLGRWILRQALSDASNWGLGAF